MENNTFPSGGVPPTNRSIGTGEGEVPLAPPIQNVTMRTMGSDIKSMQQSGGGAPTPYVPQAGNMPPPPPIGGPMGGVPRPPIPPIPPGNLPTFGGQVPRPPVVTPPSIGSQIPPQQPSPSPLGQFPPEAPKSSHGAVTGIIVFLVIVALGLAGYFFVYPYISPTATTPEIPAAVTPPEAAVPPVATPEETQPPLTKPEISTHVSLFNIAADAMTELQLLELTQDALKTNVQFLTADVPILKEIVIRTGEPDGGGEIVSMTKLSQMLAPQVFSSEAAAKSFEPDMTYFVYTDKAGTWPGIIAKPKADAIIDALKTEIAKIETSGEAKNFYLADPGATSGWKDGNLNALATRYAPFSQTGASFNYAWLPNNSLLISTSYAGFKEAAKRLGF